MMANKQQVTLKDGHGRTITVTVQTFEELKTHAVEMVNGPRREVIDLFMLDELGNVVTDVQPFPLLIRVAPTIRYH
jgi:hypothetical protein